MAEYQCGNVFIRPMVFAKAGDRRLSHAHNFDHTHYVPRGRIRARKLETIYGDGSAEDRAYGLELESRITKWRDRPAWMFWAPWFTTRYWLKWQKLAKTGGKVIEEAVADANDPLSWILIKAFVFHDMIAETDGAIGHCIYAHHTPQGEVVQEYTGWAPAYE